MAYLGDLVVRLKAETADFQQDLGKTARLLDQASRTMMRSLGGVQSALTSLGAAATVGAFAAVIKQTIDAGDQMYKMSQKTGLSVEMLSGLAHVARLSDLDVNALQMSVKKLTTAMFDTAAGGKEQAALFKGIGIAALDSTGGLRQTEDVLFDVADKFSKMKDGAEKTAIAVKLFGRTGMDMIPFLNQGAAGIREVLEEAKKLGVVMSRDMAKASEDFNDNLTRLSAQNKGLVISLTGSLLPVLIDVQKEMMESAFSSESFKTKLGDLVGQRSVVEGWAKGTSEIFAFVGDAIAGSFDVIATAVESVGVVVLQTFSNMARAAKYTPSGALANWATGALDTIVGFEESFTARSNENIQKRLARPQFRDTVGNFWDRREQRTALAGLTEQYPGGGTYEGTKPKRPTGDVDYSAMSRATDAAARLAAAELKQYESAAQALEKELGKVTNQTREQELAYQTTKGTLKGLLPVHKEHLVSLAREVDAYKQAQEAAKVWVDALEDRMKLQEKGQDVYRDYVLAQSAATQQQEFEASLIGKTAREQELLNAQRQIELDTLRAIAALPSGMDPGDYGEAVQSIYDAQLAFTEQYLSGIRQRQSAEREWSFGANKAMQEYADAAMNAAANAERFFTNAFQSMEDALVKFAQTGKLDFKSLADSIIADLIRMEVRASITGPLAAASKDAGGFGGIFGGIGKMISGWLPSFDVGTNYVPHDMVAQVHQGEAIIPASQNMQGGGGGGPVFNIDARGADRAGLAQLADQIRRLNGTFNERAVAAVFNAQARGVRG